MMQSWNKAQWDTAIYRQLVEHLWSLQDLSYRDFHQKLIPGVNNLIGIRLPLLQRLAGEIAKGDYRQYLQEVQTEHYEEVMLWGLVIGKIKTGGSNQATPQEILEWVRQFVPRIDNWAVCDCCCAGFKFAGNNQELVYDFLRKNYFSSNKEYELRFAIVMLMDYFVEPPYLDALFQLCEQIKSEYYYVKMAVAWLLSVCFVKFETETMAYLQGNHLDIFTYNKALQKIIESNRVSPEQKTIIRRMKRQK